MKKITFYMQVEFFPSSTPVYFSRQASEISRKETLK